MSTSSQNRPTTTVIDFLPAQYRQRGVKRRTYTWRFAVAAAFAGLFVVTAVLQQHHHQQVRTELSETETHYSQAVAHNAAFAKVRAEIQAHRHGAELLTYLRHPWPRTAVIAAILAPLADGFTLTDLQISHETVSRGAQPSNTLPETRPVLSDKSSGRASDLKRLLSEQAGRQDFVLLRGEAIDAAVLHEYLARVGTHPLVAKVDIRSIEHAARDQATGSDTTVHFVVRAILRTPHGQTITPKAADTTVGAAAQQAGQL